MYVIILTSLLSLPRSSYFLHSNWLRLRPQRGSPAPRLGRWLLFPCGGIRHRPRRGRHREPPNGARAPAAEVFHLVGIFIPNIYPDWSEPPRSTTVKKKSKFFSSDSMVLYIFSASRAVILCHKSACARLIDIWCYIHGIPPSLSHTLSPILFDF